MAYRSFKFRLYPTHSQEQMFREFAGVARLVYNLGLEQREKHWRQFKKATSKSLSYGTQAKELTQLRVEVDFVRAVSQTVQQQALRDLEQAYRRFFKGLGGYPTLRKRGLNDAFRFMGRECPFQRLNKRWGLLGFQRLAKCGFA